VISAIYTPLFRGDSRTLTITMKLEKEILLKLIGIFLFAAAMGYMESAVVVYLRALYYPAGFHIITQESLKSIPPKMLFTETGREFVTIVMLVSLSILVERKDITKRIAYFLFTFSIWDIFYYVWLKVLVRWPETFLTNDILFLIPRVWLAPVLAPIIISVSLIIISLFMLSSKKEISSFKELLEMWKYWLYILAAVWLIVSGLILWQHRSVYLWSNVVTGLFIIFLTLTIALARS